jgi:hypothetical protein
MKTPRVIKLFGLAAVLTLCSWSLRQPAVWAADKPFKVYIFYSSDATGYYEPCG